MLWMDALPRTSQVRVMRCRLRAGWLAGSATGGFDGDGSLTAAKVKGK